MPLRAIYLVALLGLALVLTTLPVQSQQAVNNEREVESQPSTLDKVDVWGMHFRFKDPRIIKVKLPTRGERIVWYMWYQVINRTGKPREITTAFEIVTLDSPGV